MPKYKCPVTTCNVNFEGSVYDIIIPAIMHGEGSHKMNLSEDDVARIIERQARQESVDAFVPKEPEVLPKIDSRGKRFHDWWKK